MTETAAKDISTERDLLISVYQHFNQRNIDSILALMHADVVWPNGMEGGWIHGREGVRAYWTRQWTSVNPHVEPLRFEADQSGRVVVHVHQVVRDLAGAVILDRPVQHVYQIVDGLIRNMEIRECD
jgi:hypothetical protein